jgi:hypothetical protein
MSGSPRSRSSEDPSADRLARAGHVRNLHHPVDLAAVVEPEDLRRDDGGGHPRRTAVTDVGSELERRPPVEDRDRPNRSIRTTPRGRPKKLLMDETVPERHHKIQRLNISRQPSGVRDSSGPAEPSATRFYVLRATA